MSFWTGFTTGLASSVDKGLQRAIEKRDGELSSAKKFWMQREATKREKYDIKKEKNDAEVLAGYTSLLEGFGGDKDRAKAAFDILVAQGGGVQGVTSYLEDARKRAGELPTGYTINEDFKDFVAGDSKFGGTAEDLMMKPYQGTQFKAANYGVGKSRFDELLGRTGADTDTARLEKQMNVGFNAQPAAAPAASTGAFGSIDRSRLSAAETYARQKTVEAQQDAKVQRDITAFGTNQARVKALTQQIADQEERAKRGELDAKEQKTYDRNRDKLADAERKTELEQKAEIFILEKRAKKLGITAQQLANQKAKQPPEFSDFEDMAVYATQKLAAGGLTPQQTSDFEEMRQQAIAGAKAWNAQTEADGNKKSDFSPQSVNAILDAQIKRTMGKAGLYDGVEDKVKKITEGNAESYFDNFNQAISAVEGTYGTDDEVMKNAIAQQENVLAQDVRSFIDKQLAIPAQKNKRLKIFDGSPAELVDNAYQNNPYKKGDIIQYKEGDVTKYAIWTGRDLYSGDY